MKIRSGPRRIAWGASLLAVLGLMAASCGDDDDTEAAATTAAPAAATTTTAATTTAAAAADTTSATTAAADTTAASAAADSAAWEEVIAKAKEEGSVTIYSSQGLDQLNDLAGRFEEEYGIRLEVVRAIDSDNIPKVEAEHDTGNAVADVFATASEGWAQEKGAAGWFVAPTGPSFENPDFDKANNVAYDGAFVSTAAVLTFGWNTDLYEKGLTDYADLLDPELAGGKIGVIEPATSSAVVDFYLYLEEQYGEDFVEKLAAQEPRIYPSSLPMAQALTSGEIAAASFVQVLTDEKEAGAPVESGLADTVWGSRFWTVILESAPHPNAAQLLADFIVSQPGQEAIARKAGAVLPGIEGSVTTVDKVRKQDLSKLTPEFVTQYGAEWQALFT